MEMSTFTLFTIFEQRLKKIPCEEILKCIKTLNNGGIYTMHLNPFKKICFITLMSLPATLFANTHVSLNIHSYSKLGLWAATGSAIAMQQNKVKATLLAKASTLCASLEQNANPLEVADISTNFDNAGFYLTKGVQTFECIESPAEE